MLNRYVSKCSFCRKLVNPHQGLLVLKGESWVVTHLACVEKRKEKEERKAARKPTRKKSVNPTA